MARRPTPDAVISGSWLLRRARTRTRNLPQIGLAERLDSTSAAFSRYESGSRELTVADLQRAVNHTDFRIDLRLVPERFHDPIADAQDWTAQPFHPTSLDLARRLPASLCSHEYHLTGERPEGPVISEALYTLYRLRDFWKHATAPVHRLRQAFDDHHVDRDSDLIHVLLSCGDGLFQACRILEAEIDRAVPVSETRRLRRAKPTGEPRIGLLAWAHAVCAIRAEVGIQAEAAERLASAVTAAADNEAAMQRLSAAELAAAAGIEGAEEEAARAGEEAATTGRRRAAHATMGTKDVGRAGERYLLQEVRANQRSAQHVFDELSEGESWARWRQAEAADPLYNAWLDGELAARTKPPRLLLTADDLERYLQEIARWDRAERAQIEEIGMLDDPASGRWTITAAAHRPTRADQPRPRTAALASHPDSGTYVLAEDDPTERTRQVHRTLGDRATLVELAAALA